MFKLDTLTVKNFMSVGNTTQAIDFNRNDLTLVLGENLDTGGGDAGSKWYWQDHYYQCTKLCTVWQCTH